MSDPQEKPQQPASYSWIPPERFLGATTPDYPSMAREAASRHRVDPNIFERQMAHESIEYNPDVVAGRRKSPKGAIGIAQFMPDTGARYGLRGSDLSDPAKSLDAAARHMRDLLDETGDDYEGALAGYNAGVGRVRDGSWRNISETRNYTRKILGAASAKSHNWIQPDKFFASLGAAPAETTAAPQTGGTLPTPAGVETSQLPQDPRITGSTPRNAAEQAQAERISGLLSELQAANPRTLSPRPASEAPSYPINLDTSAFSESPLRQPRGVTIDRSGFVRTPAQEIADRIERNRTAAFAPRRLGPRTTQPPLVNRDASGNPLTHDGYPAIQNADGSITTERSITVTSPQLNGGKPTNIPSVWGGRQLSDAAATEAALRSGIGYPSFGSIDEAVRAAQKRSAAKGQELDRQQTAPRSKYSRSAVTETVDVAGGAAMGEDDLYREWYGARASGQLSAADLVAKNYIERFPRGKYARHLEQPLTPRAITTERGQQTGAGAQIPVAQIEGMRRRGFDDEAILRTVQDDVATQMGLSTTDVAILTERFGRHPLANIVEPGSDARSSVESILRQGRSNAGLAQFNILPETVQQIAAAAEETRSLRDPSRVQAEALPQPHLYEGVIPGLDTVRGVGRSIMGSKAGPLVGALGAAGATRMGIDPGEAAVSASQMVAHPETAVDELIRQSESFATNTEQAMLSGMTAPFKGIAALREGLLRGRGRVSDELRQLGSIGENLDISPDGVRLRNPSDPGYRKEFAASTSESLGGQFGQAVGSSLSMMVTGAGLSNMFGISGAAAAATTGALQQAGQTYDDALRKGATKEQAAAASIGGALIGLTEGWGLGGTIDRVALKKLSGNLVKAFLTEGLEEASQEGLQNFLQNVLAHYTYDPKQGVFTAEALKKNLQAATVAFVTGGIMGGGSHAGAQLQERIADDHLIDSTERALERGQSVSRERFADYLGAVERGVAREQGFQEPEEERAPIGERLGAARDTLLGRPMPSVVPRGNGAIAQHEGATEPTATVHAPLSKSGRIDPDVVRAEVEREIVSRSGFVPVAAGAPGTITPPDRAQDGRPLTGQTSGQIPQIAGSDLTSGQIPQIAGSDLAGSSISSETANQATIPEAPEALVAQLEALRAKRGNRRAVLVTPGEQMPASQGALMSDGLAVTKITEGPDKGSRVIHYSGSNVADDPRVISKQDVRALSFAGRLHELLGVGERKSARATEAVVARHPETGMEIQAAMTSPENVPVQAAEMAAQHPENAEIPIDAAARVAAPSLSIESISQTVSRLESALGRRPTATEVVTERKRLRGEAAGIVDAAAHEAATSATNDTPPPTRAQIDAGNYKHGHVQIGGLNIAIENPEGSKRKPEWPPLKSHYGYVKRTEGKDGEPVDVFVKPGTPENYSGPVFVVDQQKANGEFDEHKAMLGWPDEASARTGYAENFTPDWKVGPIRSFASVDEFRDWLRTADTTKPAVKKPVVPFEKGATIAPEVGNGQRVKKAQLGPWAKAHKRHLQKFFPDLHRQLSESGQLSQEAFKAQENAKDRFVQLGEQGMEPHEAREVALREFVYPTPPEDEDRPEQWEIQEGELNQQSAVMSMLAKAPQKASRRNPPRTLPVTTGSKTLVN